MTMVEWYNVIINDNFCCIISGLKHADGKTLSPYYYYYYEYIVGDDCEELSLQKFKEFYEKLK